MFDHLKDKSNKTVQHYHKNTLKAFSCAQPVFSLAKSSTDCLNDIKIPVAKAVKSIAADYLRQMTDQQIQLYELQIALQVNDEDLENVKSLLVFQRRCQQ